MVFLKMGPKSLKIIHKKYQKISKFYSCFAKNFGHVKIIIRHFFADPRNKLRYFVEKISLKMTHGMQDYNN
jgi:hypothetical protein